MSELIPRDDQHFIFRAAEYLENPGFLIRVANLLGQPLEAFARVVPDRVHEAVENALTKVMDLAIRTVPPSGAGDGQTRDVEAAAFRKGLQHTLATAATGAAGGLFGIAGLAVELPISTGLMFRSIAGIADDFGEDLSQPETRLECLTIFSYGGPTPGDDYLESSYLTTRLGLAVAIRQAAQVIARTSGEELINAIGKGTASALVRLIAEVAARFNVVVSQKLLAQGVPVVGAFGGGLINAAFSDHFNTVARYHFGMRRLERRYGKEAVQDLYRLAVQQVRARQRRRVR
jgi:hypothetical protein